jgi:hypothetical protein
MKTLIKFTAFLLLLVVGLTSSCRKPIEYPIDIPFTEYYVDCSFSHLICWENLNHDIMAPDYVLGGKVTIINSNKELENYLICPEDYPAIDFSRYTLVLASGRVSSFSDGVHDIILFQNFINQYKLQATIPVGMIPTVGFWCIAILTPKIDNEATFSIDIIK